MTTAPRLSRTALISFDDNAQHIAGRQYVQPGDHDIGGMFERIAQWVAGAEAPEARLGWAQQYYDLMAGKKFCPGGRVLAGAGTQHGNVLNCFVQGATEYSPASFEGVMEVAKKLALVTKVGGGNGVNLDVYTPRAATSRPDAGVRGWVYMAASHPDVSDFVLGLMRPPTQPDGDKQPVAIRNWTRVVYGQAIKSDLVALARQNGVQIVRALPEGVETVLDDMGGIIDAARAVAETAKLGLEPRLDLSQMRPEGAAIRGSGGTSSGPVSFLMEIFDNFLEWANRGAEHSGPVNTLRYVYSPVLRVVRQGGTRRGAGMATISVSHPDVLDFLTAKDLDREASEGDISTFNISLLVDEAFWNTLQAGGVWPLAAQEVPGKYYLAEQAGDFAGSWPNLPERAEDGAKGVPIYKVGQHSGLPAAWLWDQVAQHAWSTGEPGLIFVDRINEYSALKDLGERYQIRSTNPCGEIPLTVGEPCDLGAINLAAYVEHSQFDFAGFRADVRTCVRFLDDVLDVNVFALEDNRVASQDLRRLGLGVMGLADALIKLGLRYDSAAGREMIFEIMTALREEAVAESERLGQERGVYAVYQRNADQMPHEPRRNVAVLTVAPTGTTSMLMGVSSGIEPVFSPFIWRKIGSEYRALLAPLFVELLESYPPAPNMAATDQNGGSKWDWDKVTEAVSENHGSVVGLSFIPAALQQVFVCAHDIAPARPCADAGRGAAGLRRFRIRGQQSVQDHQSAQLGHRSGCAGRLQRGLHHRLQGHHRLPRRLQAISGAEYQQGERQSRGRPARNGPARPAQRGRRRGHGRDARAGSRARHSLPRSAAQPGTDQPAPASSAPQPAALRAPGPAAGHHRHGQADRPDQRPPAQLSGDGQPPGRQSGGSDGHLGAGGRRGQRRQRGAGAGGQHRAATRRACRGPDQDPARHQRRPVRQLQRQVGGQQGRFDRGGAGELCQRPRPENLAADVGGQRRAPSAGCRAQPAPGRQHRGAGAGALPGVRGEGGHSGRGLLEVPGVRVQQVRVA